MSATHNHSVGKLREFATKKHDIQKLICVGCFSLSPRLSYHLSPFSLSPRLSYHLSPFSRTSLLLSFLPSLVPPFSLISLLSYIPSSLLSPFSGTYFSLTSLLSSLPSSRSLSWSWSSLKVVKWISNDNVVIQPFITNTFPHTGR